MMKRIIYYIILLAFSAPVLAQSITPQIGGGISKGFDGGISGPSSSAQPVVFLLDSLVATPTAAYSTRKLRSAYAGSALRVQRSSDSTQQDIGFNTTTWQLDNAALSAFVGASTGTVFLWYDQSGNGNDSGAFGAQPRIVNAGTPDTYNGHVSARYGPVALGALAVGTITLPQPTTIAMAAKFNSVVTNAHYTDGVNATPRQLVGTSGTAYSIYAGGPPTNGGTTDTGSHCVIALFNTASSLVVDGTQIISASVGANGMGLQVIGAGNGGGSSAGNVPIDGWIGEYLVFPVNITSPDQTKIRASWQTQWGTP